MRCSFSKVLELLYPTVEAAAEAMGTGSAILVSNSSGSKLTRSDYAAAYSVGLVTGAVVWITCRYFQVVEMRKNLPDNQENDLERGNNDVVNIYITKRRMSAYLVSKYVYIITSITADLMGTALLVSAAKARKQDLFDGENIPLTFLSRLEIGMLVLYYTLFKLPFKSTNEMTQTCKQTLASFGMSASQAPDRHLMDALQKLIRPIANNNKCRKWIRITGSICDTIDHVAPLVIIIPAAWILSLLQHATENLWVACAATVLLIISIPLLIILTGTVLTQTYLFEGKFSESNLKEIAAQTGEILEEDTPWVNPKTAFFFGILLYFGGLLHGVDTSLAISLTLREWGAPAALILVASLVAFFVAWGGNHYSEVMESQKALKAITLPELSSNENSFFYPMLRRSQDYGSTANLEFTKVPTQLLDYQPASGAENH